MPKIRIPIKRSAGGEGLVDFEATDDEWEVLDDFAVEAERLAASSFLREGGSVSITLAVKCGEPATSKQVLPDERDLAELLMRLRPFILEKEPTSYNRVHGILRRGFADESMQRKYGALQKEFSGKGFQAQVKIQASTGEIINSEELLMKWLNSHEYHRDKDKARDLAELTASLPDDFSRALFISMLIDKVKAIQLLANDVRALQVALRSSPPTAPPKG